MKSVLAGFALAACCIAYVLLDPSLHGDAQEVHPTSAESAASHGGVTIAHCRVKLIHDVQLAGERPGILSYVAAEGDTVRSGQLVVQIRDNVAVAGYQVAEKMAANDVEVRFARKATELAQLKYLRAVEANKQSLGTVSELELRELRLQAEKSLLQLEQAEQQFLLAGLRRDETREQLRTYRVEAPFDATVLNVYKQAGEVVREGDPILEVASTKWVRVEGYLPVEDAHRVSIDSPVQVQAEYAAGGRIQPAGPTFAGEIRLVGTKVEPVTNKVRVWAMVANPGGELRDGMTATMRVARPAAAETGNVTSALPAGRTTFSP